MADPDACADAITALAAKLDRPGEQRANGLDRMVSAHVTDLGLTFRGHLHDGNLTDVTTEPGPDGDITIALTSDDLVALAAGQLSLVSAWLSGRVKIRASFTDLLRLRSMG